MKRFFVVPFLMLILVVPACFGENVRFNNIGKGDRMSPALLDQLSVHGPVINEYIEESSISEEFGETVISKDKDLKEIKTYSPEGELLFDNIVGGYDAIHCNQDGLIDYTYIPGNYKKIKFDYDENGFLKTVEDLRVGNDELYLYIFENNKLITKKQIRIFNNKLEELVQYTYENGTLTKEEAFDSQGDKEYIIKYIYENGNLIKKFILRSDSGEGYKYHYNKIGDLDQQTRFAYDYNTKKETSSSVFIKYELKYDAMGNVKEITYKNMDENQQFSAAETFKYTFDQFDTYGNWVQGTFYVCNTDTKSYYPIKKLYRTLIYRKDKK